MCQAALPGMRERGWGRIVAITSIGARQPIGNLAASSVARAGVAASSNVSSPRRRLHRYFTSGAT